MENSKEQLSVTAQPEKVIPKLVTKVALARAGSGNVVLTFIFGLPGEGSHLVNRIVLDATTAKELQKLLGKSTEGTDNAK